MTKLEPVPDQESIAPSQRATTTSFRIPVFLFNKCNEEAERLGTSLSRIYLRALTQYFETFTVESWATADEQDAYDPTRFYTYSQDKKGHSVGIRINIPKPLAGELSNLAKSGTVPAYRSTEDVVRDALYHRVKQIARMVDNGELEVAVDMAMLMSDELQMMDEAEEAKELIDAVRSNAQAIYARDGGNMTRLKRYLAQRRELADSIPLPYRADYLSAIEDYEKRIEPKKSKRRKK